MRTPYLIFIALFISNWAHSQDWTLINPSYRYHYSTTTVSTYAEKVILVDSISESTYYLNRIVAPCDTCSNTNLYYRDASQFLMKEFNANTNQFTADKKSFVIYPDSISWRLNDSTIASLDTTLTESVFGVNDSIKIISLSNGGYIHLSKNFGVSAFALEPSNPQYLIGIDSLTMSSRWKLGYTYPKHWDIYDYEVGDVFQSIFKKSHPDFCGGFESCQGYVTKRTVLDKWIVGDSLFYQVKRLIGLKYAASFSNWTTGGEYPVYDTIVENYHPNTSYFTSSYPGELIYDSIILSYVVINTVDSSIYTENYDGVKNSYLSYPLSLMRDNLLVYGGNTYNSIKVGVGITNDEIQVFEYQSWDFIIGYVKNGDTTGIVHPDDLILATSTEFSDSKPEVYPNPCSDYLSVNSFFEDYEIFNSLGTIIVFGKLVRNQLDVSKLETGVYFLKISNSNKNFIYKIFKE